jgi:peptidoglycan hydrolase-like protein with peptidoglycan-binding domain
MDKRVITTMAAIALPLALSFPALAQDASAPPAQAPAAAPQASQSTAPVSLTRDQITQLQQALNDNGFDAGEVDGVFGAKTSAALKQFQSKAGLQPTGRIDQQTLALVGMSGAAPQAPGGAGATTGQGAASPAPASPPQPSQSPQNPK